ncbi:hypothetical protein LTSEUGA_5579 [Salmonella enterica subsp. enterica serovar Uganda str. R8-3404]|uniref:Uncharacterized protein n=1 Tax=Salmonella enterica subsp. enterica serovar Uganda str. R8-3404 TaxID=913083 RepID=A0A6C8GWG0_SALET|nr:hypothetical protein LTSEUGA_5579 [Salmonella enterica subsp. enterica serovar Uganda str. R8-3404]
MLSAAPSGVSTPHVHKHFLFGTMRINFNKLPPFFRLLNRFRSN